MGKRGPKKTSTEILNKRGSWLAPARKKAEAAAKRPKFRARKLPRSVTGKQALACIRHIPGFDPYFGAEPYIFDKKAAAGAINFFQQKLTHVKGELTGQPFILELWEKAIIANLFGWKHKRTGLRRFREAFIEVGRKNGKTPLAAGILLYLLFEDKEPGAEIYGAASEYKQASLVFTHARGMIRREESLDKDSHIFKGQAKAIEKGEPGDDDYGIYRVISADAFSAQGFNTHGAVVDELHTQPNRDLVDALLTSIGARRQPLIVYITTSDFERESICNEKEEYAIKVRDQIIHDPSFLPVLYMASVEDDWADEGVWKKANPNLGVSLSLDYLRRECKRAKETPTYENTFKRLHLNIRTEQDVRWLPMADWDACDGSVTEKDLIGKTCLAGLDLSSNTDITAFVMAFPVDDNWIIVPRFWIPGDNARKRERRDRVPYMTWAKQGLIKLTPGNVVDYNTVLHDIAEDCEKFDVRQIGYDRFGAEAVRQRLVEMGVSEEKVISFGQGFVSMSAPSKELETLILARKLTHGGHPVLRWMASNVSVEIDAAGNIKPSKKKSTEKIDGIVGLIMALGVSFMVPTPQESVYESRGILTI